MLFAIRMRTESPRIAPPYAEGAHPSLFAEVASDKSANRDACGIKPATCSWENHSGGGWGACAQPTQRAREVGMSPKIPLSPSARIARRNGSAQGNGRPYSRKAGGASMAVSLEEGRAGFGLALSPTLSSPLRG